MSVIAISRQFGTGAKTLGEMVAEKLNYTFFENDIIQMVAKQAKVSTHLVESIEKDAGDKLLKFIQGLARKSFVDRILYDKHSYIDEEIYVDLLYKIINKIADEGNAVILGRGAQYILRDRADAFHVLLIAEKPDRIRYMEKRYNLTPEQAEQTVNREEKRRLNLYKQFGKEDYDCPDLYHLVLNMSKLKLEKAFELICELPVD